MRGVFKVIGKDKVEKKNVVEKGIGVVCLV